MAGTTAVGLLAAVATIGRVAGEQAALGPVVAGLLVAAGSSVLGFEWLQQRLPGSGSAFAGRLLALFLGRVALVAAFGLALHAAAPAHLAAGLLSLAGFHFVLMVIEVVLLVRSAPHAGDATAPVTPSAP